jgi:hypothetical protein
VSRGSEPPRELRAGGTVGEILDKVTWFVGSVCVGASDVWVWGFIIAPPGCQLGSRVPEVTFRGNAADMRRHILGHVLHTIEALVCDLGVNVLNPPGGLTSAAGDGVTDDAPALQAIIDVHPGHSIYLP